jgi:hypothetical protein
MDSKTAIGFFVRPTVGKNDNCSDRIHPLDIGNIDAGHAFRGLLEFEEALQTLEDVSVPFFMLETCLEVFPGIVFSEIEKRSATGAPGMEYPDTPCLQFGEPFFQCLPILEGYGNNDFVRNETAVPVVLLNKGSKHIVLFTLSLLQVEMLLSGEHPPADEERKKYGPAFLLIDPENVLIVQVIGNDPLPFKE